MYGLFILLLFEFTRSYFLIFTAFPSLSGCLHNLHLKLDWKPNSIWIINYHILFISLNNKTITLSKHDYNAVWSCCSRVPRDMRWLANVKNERQQSNGKIQGWLNKASVSLSYPWCFLGFFWHPPASVASLQLSIIQPLMSSFYPKSNLRTDWQ